MIVSGQFNKKFHATLADILDSNKKIEVEVGKNLVILDTKKMDIEGIKIMLKLLDSDYPKTDKEPSKKRTKIPVERLRSFYEIFGYPASMTEISGDQLSSHLVWIQSVCIYNNITLHDRKWDALFEKAKEYDN